jgi:hypothetical protein
MLKSKSAYGWSFLISEFDAFPRDATCLVHCTAFLDAEDGLSYVLLRKPGANRNSACLGLTECETDQVRAETVGSLRTMLATQIGLPELPASFDRPRDADGAGIVLNG